MRDLLGLPWPCCFCPRWGLGFGDALGFTFASLNALGRHGIVCWFRAFYLRVSLEKCVRGFNETWFLQLLFFLVMTLT
jgi:hypothetical protein